MAKELASHRVRQFDISARISNTAVQSTDVGLTMSGVRASGNVDRMLGAVLRLRRAELGMSQEQLAAALGVTFQQVQKYEKGLNRISASRLYDAAAALDMPVTQFFAELSAENSRGEQRTPSSAKLLSSPEAIELLRFFGMIESKHVRRRVVDLVRAMSSEN